MAVLKNRAKMSTSTTGTGTITLGSAESGYQTFGDAGVANADVVRYVIEDGTAWEIGTGTYTATGTTLTRTVSESSNADAAIVLTGSATVFIGATAEDILSNVVEDATPQLGGNLDVQTREITTSTTNGNVKLTPNGTGVVEVKGAGGNDGTLQINCSDNSHGVKIKSPPHSAAASYTLTLPDDDGAASEFLQTDGSGSLSWATAGGGSPDLFAESYDGTSGLPVATGSTNAVAIGRAYAEGTDSFAAAIARNTSSYGAIGANSVALGDRAKASLSRGIAIGGYGALASGVSSVALGYAAEGTATYASGIGYQSKATANYSWASNKSVASGIYSTALGISDTSTNYGAQHPYSVAIGYQAVTSADYQISLGSSTAPVKVSGAYTLPTADGTANQVLTTDGSGAVTFATAGGGGGASAISIDIKTADYTVVAGDLGKIIKYAGAGADRTVTLTAGATLGDGFYVTISNANTGADERVVIDPNGTEKFGWSNGPQTITLSRGEMVKIVWDNTNSCWIIGEGGFNLAIRNDINPAASVLVGDGTNAGFAAGYDAQATGSVSVALGRGVATGGTSVALGKAYASGTDSFAAAIANNTSSYGATGGNSVAIGQQARASGLRAVAIGYSALATATRSYALSAYGNATQAYGATLFGARAASSVQGKAAYGPAYLVGQGQVQGGMLVCTVQTTDATASTLTTTNGSASTTNQIILPNNSAYSFSGTIIARQQAADGSNYASWEIKGALLRDANAASTVLGNGIVNKLFATAGASAWAIALTADTTNGGLKIEATGAAATDIRWVATVNTSEVTYA